MKHLMVLLGLATLAVSCQSQDTSPASSPQVSWGSPEVQSAAFGSGWEWLGSRGWGTGWVALRDSPLPFHPGVGYLAARAGCPYSPAERPPGLL